MKRTLGPILGIATGVAVGLVTPDALALDTVELTVTATMMPAACGLILQGGGVVNFGTVSAGQLSSNSMTILPARDIALTVSCNAPTSFALRFIDNRKPTVVSAGRLNQEFGLGSVGGKGIGYYLILPEASLADSQSAGDIRSQDGGARWTDSTSLAIEEDTLYSFASKGAISPGIYQNATINLKVIPYLDKKPNLRLKDAVGLNGSATIEIVYL